MWTWLYVTYPHLYMLPICCSTTDSVEHLFSYVNTKTMNYLLTDYVMALCLYVLRNVGRDLFSPVANVFNYRNLLPTNPRNGREAALQDEWWCSRLTLVQARWVSSTIDVFQTRLQPLVYALLWCHSYLKIKTSQSAFCGFLNLSRELLISTDLWGPLTTEDKAFCLRVHGWMPA